MEAKSLAAAGWRSPAGSVEGRCGGLAATLAVALFASSAAAQDDLRRIEWRDHEFPPFFIWSGPQKGQGIADVISEMIREEMGAWSHTRVLSELADTTQRMRAGEQVCSAAYVRTPSREKYLVFSIPDMILPPNGITLRSDHRERFGGSSEVELAALLRDPSLKLAVAQGRSYGGEIDAILDRHRGRSHVYTRLAPDVYRTLFEMLLKGSTDYIIGYPYEAVFHARRLAVEDRIMSLPIAENRQYVFAHVVCPKTPWGAAVVEEIDAVLRRLRTRDDYRAAIERWLDPGLLNDFRRRYREELLGAE